MSAYLMEDPREAERLASKVDAEAWVAEHIAPWLPEDGAFLDVGCGPGVIAAAVACARSRVAVTGFDASEERLRIAKENFRPHPSARTVQGDAVALPFPDDSFDVVHCRFLLEYLKDKARAVTEMARVCRPGGMVLLHDLDGQLCWRYPEDQALADGVGRTLEHMARSGFDPLVGRKLHHLALLAGLQPQDVGIRPYHFYAGGISARERRLWALKLDIARPVMRAALGSEQAAEDLILRFLGYLDRTDALTYSLLFSVRARKNG